MKKDTPPTTSAMPQKNRKRHIWIPLLIGVAASLMPTAAQAAPEPNPTVATGANPALWNVTWNKTYYVSTTGSDTNTGTSRTASLRTIQEAIDRGRVDHAALNHVRILVAPGTYRESININYNPVSPGRSLLIARDGTTGTVTISGATSRPPANWTEGSTSGRFYIPWTNNWGFTNVPTYFSPQAPVLNNTLLARKEGVFLNGSPMRQVLQMSALSAGTFYVDETNDRLWIAPSDGSLVGDNIEVVTNDERADGCSISNSERVCLRDLRFVRFPVTWLQANLGVYRSKDIYLDGCTIDQSTSAGCNLGSPINMTIDNCFFTRNGSVSLAISDGENVLITNSHFNNNNYRGNWMNYTGWYIAGCKMTGTNKVKLDGCEFADNITHGLWFDEYCSNMVVNNCLMDNCYSPSGIQGESGYGIFIEISYGPCKVTNSTMTACSHGAYVSNAPNVSLRNNNLIDNINSGLAVRNVNRNTGGETGRPQFCDNFWFVNNTVASHSGKNSIQLGAAGSDVTDSNTRTQNTWNAATFFGNNYYTSDTTSFQWVNGSAGFVNFANWKANTSLDTTSSTYSSTVP